MSTSANKSRGYLAVRVLIGLVGITLSVVLHELFHILMHWGRISHISLFPKWGTIVEIDAHLSPGYDLAGEEMAAYGITLVVIFITTVIIFMIGDSEDKRSSGQILFPKDKNMQKLNPSEMLELSDLDETVRPTQPAPKRTKKTRR